MCYCFRKRILAKQRAEEKKKEEEAQRLAAQAKKEKKIPVEQHNSSKVPIYLLKPTPPLPSNDCYDSDDERYTEKKPGPTWASSEYFHSNKVIYFLYLF